MNEIKQIVTGSFDFLIIIRAKRKKTDENTVSFSLKHTHFFHHLFCYFLFNLGGDSPVCLCKILFMANCKWGVRLWKQYGGML